MFQGWKGAILRFELQGSPGTRVCAVAGGVHELFSGPGKISSGTFDEMSGNHASALPSRLSRLA